jgi:hypothetical protein
LKYNRFYKLILNEITMGTNIEMRVKIGDWVKPSTNSVSLAKYINVTERNVHKINESFKNSKTKNNYVLIEGEEIKDAENYLEALRGIKIGDFILPVN